MTGKTLAHCFSSLSSERQAQELAYWLEIVTVDARDTYIPATQAIADPVRLRGFNELQHKLAAQLRSILAEEQQQYPYEVFFAMILDASGELRAVGLRRELEKLVLAQSAGNRSKRRAG